MNGTFITAAALLLSIAAIVFLMLITVKKQAKKSKEVLNNKLDRLTSQHNLSLSQKDFLRKRVIAIDDKNNILILIDDTQNIAGAIDIRKITKCAIEKVSTKITAEKKGGASEEHLEKMQLELLLNNGSKVKFTFYDAQLDGIFELQQLKELAEKWKQIILKSDSSK